MSLAHSRSPAKAPRRSAQNAAALVTAEIARFLEQDHMPWRMPWDATRAHAMTPGLPLRATGQAYRGANVILLWAAQLARGYAKRTWLTYKQAEALGAQVRKGEKASPVVYYGQAKSKSGDGVSADGEAEERRFRFLKLYHVFNVEQVDCLPDGFGAEIVSPIPQAPSAFQIWCERAGARIRTGGASAHYAPATDTIHLPPIGAFADKEQWAATLAHETIHFTGHSSRLDRLSDYFTDRKARAREELTAELGAAILGAMIELRPDHLENHAAYIGDWLRLVRDDPSAFLSAGAKAQAAVDWLIARAGHPASEADAAHYQAA